MTTRCYKDKDGFCPEPMSDQVLLKGDEVTLVAYHIVGNGQNPKLRIFFFRFFSFCQGVVSSQCECKKILKIPLAFSGF